MRMDCRCVSCIIPAYDAFIIGVTPDYIIQVRAYILEEEDGPVLQHGLMGLHK